MKRLTMQLPCPLSDAELVRISAQMILHQERSESLKVEAKSTAEAYKSQIAGHVDHANELRAEFKGKAREQDVECAEVIFQAAGELVVVRLDTGAEISRRALKQEERQGDLLEKVPADDEEAKEKAENDRIVNLLEMSDMLRECQVRLALQSLWEITTEQIVEGRKWALAIKMAGEADEKPEKPAWMTELEEATAHLEMGERELDIRVNTIKALLAEHPITADESDIRSWSKLEQDRVMEWSDSLTADSPLPRPEFLTRYERGSETWMPPAGADQVAGELTQDDDAQTNAPPEVLDTSEDLAFDLETLAESNGHYPAHGMSREDMAIKIQELGVDVDLVKIQDWSLEEEEKAFEWIVATQEAINSNGERKQAPAFFFE